MAPVNLEKNIREKLQERELQPSSESWDKLSAQLGTPQQQKSGGYFWFAIAASLVGVLLISGYFLTKTQSGLENQVVEDSNIQELIDVSPIDKTEKELNVIDNGSSITNDQSQEDPSFLNKESLVKMSPISETNQLNDIVEVEIAKEPIRGEKNIERNMQETVAVIKNLKINKSSTPDPIDKDALFVTNKVSEVVASVQDIQSKNKEVSMEEIDALLAQAQRDIAMERILSATKVDAQALLMDVELDLERTFRDRVFYALGEGFDYVKTTVVNGHE